MTFSCGVEEGEGRPLGLGVYSQAEGRRSVVSAGPKATEPELVRSLLPLPWRRAHRRARDRGREAGKIARRGKHPSTCRAVDDGVTCRAHLPAAPLLWVVEPRRKSAGKSRELPHPARGTPEGARRRLCGSKAGMSRASPS